MHALVARETVEQIEGYRNQALRGRLGEIEEADKAVKESSVMAPRRPVKSSPKPITNPLALDIDKALVAQEFYKPTVDHSAVRKYLMETGQ